MNINSRDLENIYTVPNFFPVDFSNITYDKFSSVTRKVVNYLFPKQTMRPEFSESFLEAASYLRTNLAFRSWQFTSLFRKNIPSQLGTDYTHVLTLLKNQTSTKSPSLLLEDKQAIEKMFSQINERGNDYLVDFDFFIVAKKDEELKKQHDFLKKLFGICNPDFFENFKTKLQTLLQIPNVDEANLTEEQKLGREDFLVIIHLSSLKLLLQNLRTNGVENVASLYLKIEELEKLTTTPLFEEIKKLCIESVPSGAIQLSDRRSIVSDPGFDLKIILRKLLVGRIHHIAIVVNPANKGLHLSHLTPMTNAHAVTRVIYPTLLPFHYFLILNIKSIIPKTLPPLLQQNLCEKFSVEFRSLAQEEHPELSLGLVREQSKALLLGHTSLYSQDFEKVTFPPSGTKVMCTTYIAIVFIKTIQKLNAFLEQQKIVERIPYPFSRYENLMNLDILRLTYLWNKAGIIEPLPMNSKLEKVIHLTNHWFV